MAQPRGAVWPLYAVLNGDVCRRIRAHLSALRVQAGWRRHRWRHARARAWAALRAHICAMWTLSDYCELERYAQVRTEWRTEPQSWLHVDGALASLLRTECEAGYWGRRTETSGGRASSSHRVGDDADGDARAAREG